MIGEGEYNLNALKQILVSDSFLDLEKRVRKCQNDMAFDECNTKNHNDYFLKECGCLPFNIWISKEVRNLSNNNLCITYTNYTSLRINVTWCRM